MNTPNPKEISADNIFAREGVCLRDASNEERSSEIVRNLNQFTMLCFGKPIPLQETEERVAEASHIHLLLKNNKLIGYGLNTIKSEGSVSVNYFGSSFIHPEFRGKDLYIALNLERSKVQSNAVVARTQHPRVYSGLKHLAHIRDLRISPSLNGTVVPELHDIACLCFPSADPYQVCREVYGRELMNNTPIYESDLHQIFSKLNLQRGDGLVVVVG